jgi:hypothetical protein
VYFCSLSTISWIAFSATLGSARLIFSHFKLFWPLYLVASLLCCSILDPDLVSEFYAEQNVRYPRKLCPWNFYVRLLRSYHYLIILVNWREETVVAPKYLFCRTRLLVISPESQNIFLPIPRLITPRNGQWSLVPYLELWVQFRVVWGKRPVTNPLVSVFQPPECTRCHIPIYL